MENKLKGKIYKSEDNGWVVKYSFTPYNDYVVYERELPLHPDDVADLIDLSNIFDNVEARVAAYPQVEFEIIEHQKMDGAITYAKLIKS